MTKDFQPYIFGDPEIDLARLTIQTRLFSGYLQTHAPQFVGTKAQRILDMGCSEGLLTVQWQLLYPHAQVVGIDKDEVAIEKARAGHRFFKKMEWMVGNVEVALPPGPFDVIYASLIMLHLHDLQGVIARVYHHLAPGGVFWLHDMDGTFATTYPSNPPYQELASLTLKTNASLGGHLGIARYVEPLLPAAGFTDIHTEAEVYPLGGTTADGQTASLVMLGVFYNARRAICRTQQIEETRLKYLQDEAVALATDSRRPAGKMPLVNILARRPH